MKKVFAGIAVAAFLVIITMVCLLTPPSQHQMFAQVGPSGLNLVQTAAFPSDPCQNPSVVKLSAKLNVTTATTTEIVAPVAGKSIYVCRVLASVVGTSPTVQFESGTKVSTACDTNPVTITGAVAVPTTTIISWGGAETILNDPAATELCLVSGGTTPNILGWIDYVQQ